MPDLHQSALHHTACTAVGVLTTCQSCGVRWGLTYMRFLNFGHSSASETGMTYMQIALYVGLSNNAFLQLIVTTLLHLSRNCIVLVTSNLIFKLMF